ncbi:MAG TPA: carboxypeptidase regulatory-like domain-containing protein, partial [Terriglobales bacterium]|nr:carboxypeptidase regulatory-like domain-containing protein [Terriglobales bacterium]
MNKNVLRVFLALTALLLTSAAQLSAQATGSIKGQVLDPSGAVVAGATVTAKSASGQTASATSNSQGNYEIKGLAPGAYSISVTAQGFSAFTTDNLQVAAGKPTSFDVPLQIQVEQQQVQVEAEAPTVSTAADSNASMVVLKDKDLEALSDDPDELQSELEALAGPAAGPNGGQIYIDGFTGGQLPPKSSIREIRVNSNPFSPEFDRLGYGRIEILTKPGTDSFHGSAYFNISNSTLNSKNPFVTSIPPYQTDQYSGSLGGPINKKASFFFNIEHRNIGEANVVNATVLDQNFNPVQLSEAIANPRVRTNLSPRVDIQLGKNDTLTLRYQYEWNHDTNDGIGLFNLPSLAYNSSQNEHQIQASESHIFSPNLVSDFRFRFEREFSSDSPQNFGPAISVPGSFVSGGNTIGVVSSLNDNEELQENMQYVHGTHGIKFGGRVRVNQIGDTSTGGYNGSFSFPSLLAYQITEQGLAQGLTMQQIQANGGGPDQFVITTGQPQVSFTYADVGLYASDDWKARPNLTVSYGLRYETQN